ncbi:MAG: GNAT family N-acetyltransferase [Lachnospiraceae bacterium]|nr:GNAT family N-acetyltransferase [Lachnospiraceae bacterium]
MKLTNYSSQPQLTKIETLYLSAFPAQERKPFSLLVQKSLEGIVELLAIEDEKNGFLGLAITVLHKNLVLLDYFAIDPKLRGQNIGSQTLRLLKERYASKELILEIEDPREPSPNQAERIRRKSFYLKNEMKVMPYPVDLFGVKMLILTCGRSVSFPEYHEIYRSCFSEKISSNIKLLPS